MSDDDFQQDASYWGSPKPPVAKETGPKPNKEAMRQHIEMLVAPARGSYDDALFEIAYGAAPTNARLFGLDEVSEAVDFAAAQNLRTDNLYIGATLKLPDTPRDRRTSAANFYVGTAVPVDVDANYDAVRAAMVSKLHDSPLTVTTGTTPERRSHHWFLLNKPCDDAEEYGDAFAALVCSIGGDVKVKDAARVMRLGGTISWPDERKKAKGYKVELTQVWVNPSIDKVAIERLLSLEPVERYAEAKAGTPTGLNFDGEIVLDGTGLVIDGRELFFRNYLYHLICKFQDENGADPAFEDVFEPAFAMFQRRVANPHEWPRQQLEKRARNTLRRLMADHLPTKSISGGKWEPHQKADAADWWGSFKAQLPGIQSDYKIPEIKTLHQLIKEYVPRSYVVDGVLRKGFLYTPTGRSGHLKTMAFIRIGVDVALGNSVGPYLTEQCNVAFMAGENPELVTDRLAMLCEKEGFPTDDLPFYVYQDTFKLDVGYKQVVADAERLGGFGLVIVDTFSAYCRVNDIDENDNPRMGKWTKDVLRQLTQLPGKPCVLAISHPAAAAMTKLDLKPRGASATMGEVDGIITVWREGNIVEIEAHSEKFRGAPFNLKMQMVVGKSDTMKDERGKPIEEIYGRVITQDDADKAEEDAERQDISILQGMEDYYHDNDEWPSARQLGSRLGITPERVSARQRFMASEKGLRHVAKTRRTKTSPYKLTKAGEEYMREIARDSQNKFIIDTGA